MIKRLVIKLFRLNDIEDVITRARYSERKRAEEEKEKELLHLKTTLGRKHDLEMQSKNTEIALIKKELSLLERKSKEVDALEYRSRVQIKENFRVATEISMIIKNISMQMNGVYQDIITVTDAAEKHQRRIEE